MQGLDECDFGHETIVYLGAGHKITDTKITIAWWPPVYHDLDGLFPAPELAGVVKKGALVDRHDLSQIP